MGMGFSKGTNHYYFGQRNRPPEEQQRPMEAASVKEVASEIGRALRFLARLAHRAGRRFRGQ